MGFATERVESECGLNFQRLEREEHEMSRTSEVKVGIIVIIAALALAFVLYFLMGPGRIGPSWTLDILFDDARGLTGGEPVRMAGVEIGEVKQVFLAANRKANVRVRIKHEVRLYNDYLFTISTGALVAERFVEVQPVSANAGKLLTDYDQVRGMKSPAIEDLLATAQGLMSRLEETTASVNSIIGDPAVQGATKSALTQLEITTRETAAMMGNMEQMSAQLGPYMIKLAEQLALAGEEAQKSVTFLSRRLQTSPAPKQLEETITALRDTAREAKEIAAGLRAITSNPATQGNIQGMLANFNQLSENLKQASENLRDFSADFKSEAPRIKKIIDRAETVSGDLSQLKDKLKPPQITPSFGFVASPNKGRSFSDASFDLSFAGEQQRFYRLGVADIGEENQFNLQIGRRTGKRNLRYGLVRSKLGGGLDLPVSNLGMLSLDIFDPNRVRADITAEYLFSGRAGGWGLVLGVRDTFGQDIGFIGARYGQ